MAAKGCTIPSPDLLSTLPIELILQIAECLPSVQDERDLMLTSRRLFTILTAHILRHALSSEPAFPGFVSAAEQGQLDSLRMFLRRDVESRGEFLTHELKAIALFWACSRGRREAVDLLLAAGADPNYPIEFNLNGTALHEAVYSEDLRIVRALLDTGVVDANRADDNGWTALHHAATQSADMIRLLVEVAEADVDARESSGQTPLYIARVAVRCFPAVARVLVELGADPGVRDATGRTAQEALEYLMLSRPAKDDWRWRECLKILKEARLRREGRR